jgi:hypothetical protein
MQEWYSRHFVSPQLTDFEPALPLPLKRRGLKICHSSGGHITHWKTLYQLDFFYYATYCICDSRYFMPK